MSLNLPSARAAQKQIEDALEAWNRREAEECTPGRFMRRQGCAAFRVPHTHAKPPQQSATISFPKGQLEALAHVLRGHVPPKRAPKQPSG